MLQTDRCYRLTRVADRCCRQVLPTDAADRCCRQEGVADTHTDAADICCRQTTVADRQTDVTGRCHRHMLQADVADICCRQIDVTDRQMSQTDVAGMQIRFARCWDVKIRGVEKGSGRHFTIQGRERSVFNQTNIGTVSKATLGRLLRDGAERVWAFPSATMPF